jgi:uncharacterized membrane protein (GlpM family)
MSGSPEGKAAAKANGQRYKILFWSHGALPLVACGLFLAIAYLVLSRNENYWLGGLIAAPPTMAILTLFMGPAKAQAGSLDLS